MTIKKRTILQAYVLNYLNAYPCSEIEDVYKRLYQVFHGSEHAVTDRDKAREWLMEEWESVSSEPTPVPLVEIINIKDVTPYLCVVNLAPAKDFDLDPDAILDEFLRTSEQFPKEINGRNLHDAFVEGWGELGEALSERGLDQTVLASFTAKMKNAGWPQVHHSERYRKEYDPHYRLIMDPAAIVP